MKKTWDGETPYKKSHLSGELWQKYHSLQTIHLSNGYRDAMNGLGMRLYEAALLGLFETEQRMSDHECHNDDCHDARAKKKIKLALDEFEKGLKE